MISRHAYKVERVANLFKGAAAKQIIDEGRHPLVEYAKPKQRPPRMWAAHAWKVYLNSEEAIENTIHYVEDNREKENKVKQKWEFVNPTWRLNDSFRSQQHIHRGTDVVLSHQAFPNQNRVDTGCFQSLHVLPRANAAFTD